MDEPLAIPQQVIPPEVMERLLIGGDLAGLNAGQRAEYYQAVCRSLGLNPLTKPFEYLTLNGKLRLYALRDCADQLRKLHGISIIIVGREKMGDVFIVTAHAKDRSGREDESTGVVTLGNLKGDALANALMKCETKAKRRVTLSIAGLGFLDETELETIPPQGGRPSTAASVGQALADPHPTAQEIDELVDLAKSAFGDLAHFSRYLRAFFELPEDFRATKKWMRETMSPEDYDQIRRHCEGLIKEHVENDVQDHQPPWEAISEGEVSTPSPDGDRAATGESRPANDEEVRIWATPEEVEEVTNLARQAGQKYLDGWTRFVGGHKDGRVRLSKMQEHRELITKALNAMGRGE